MTIDSKMLSVPAQILGRPAISYPGASTSLEPDFKAQWALEDIKLTAQGFDTPVKYYVLCEKQSRSEDETSDLSYLDIFDADMKNYGFANIERVGSCDIKKTAEIDKTIQSAVSEHCNLVILFLARKSTEKYSAFKERAELVHGLSTICLCKDTMDGIVSKEKKKTKGTSSERALKGYMANIAMKLNLKFRGTNHTVKGLSDELADTMIIGSDVTHPGHSAAKGTPSIAAVVATVGPDAGKFLGSMRTQPGGGVEVSELLNTAHDSF